MIARKKLENEIIGLTDLKELIESYEEIASIRMRRVKNFVLRNREFLEGLTDMYHEVGNYNEYIKRQEQKIKEKPKLEKSVAILLSSNTMLYGNIIRKTFEDFYTYITSNDIEVVIVGKTGRQMMIERDGSRKIKYFELSDSALDNVKLREIYDYASKYDGIYVFHPRFESILQQISTSTVISEKIEFEQKEDRLAITNYIFEPSFQEVLNFFDKEIVLSIFEQTLHESNLSKFASRMISLDYAVDNIGTTLSVLNMSHERVKHSIMNNKQLNVLAGISLWKGNN